MVVFLFIRFLATVLLFYCVWLLLRLLVRGLFMPGRSRRPRERVQESQRKYVKSSVIEDPPDGEEA